MSKMYFEVKKYIPEKHIFDFMNFLKEKNINFIFYLLILFLIHPNLLNQSL